MMSSFAESVLMRLADIGHGAPRLVSQSYDDENFGNATATVEMDDVKLLVVNDRGLWTVDVVFCNPPGNSAHPALRDFLDGKDEPLCPLETFAVALGWIPLEELVTHYGLEGRGWAQDTDPPRAVPEFRQSLDVAAGTLGEFTIASRSHTAQQKAGDLDAQLQARLAAHLNHGAQDGATWHSREA